MAWVIFRARVFQSRWFRVSGSTINRNRLRRRRSFSRRAVSRHISTQPSCAACEPQTASSIFSSSPPNTASLRPGPVRNATTTNSPACCALSIDAVRFSNTPAIETIRRFLGECPRMGDIDVIGSPRGQMFKILLAIRRPNRADRPSHHHVLRAFAKCWPRARSLDRSRGPICHADSRVTKQHELQHRARSASR